MSTSYSALCSDFYINQKLALKMDLPTSRETVLDLFSRIRKSIPVLERFRRYEGELSLESPVRNGQYAWMGLRQTCIKSGWVNPDDLEEAYKLHQLLLEICPYFLSISPLDVEYVELVFGFDLQAEGNHDAIVFEALLSGTPLGRLLEEEEAQAIDVQPFLGMNLKQGKDLHAFYEIKTRSTSRSTRSGEYSPEPISIYLTIRRYGAVNQPEDLLEVFTELRVNSEKLVEEHVIPDLLTPLRDTIGLSGF